MATVPLYDRMRGALLGLACGDALGAPVEFKSHAYVRERFGTLTEMVGGGPWAPGEWTDDTGMALCIAEGILEAPADPMEAVGRRFLAWCKGAKDVGATISAALDSVGRHGSDWFEASRTTPQAASGKAAGNGSLMRCLPVALAYREQPAMLRQSARLSAMTHWDPQAETCCAIYCLWIKRLLAGMPMREAWRETLAAARELAAVGPADAETPGWSATSDSLWTRLEATEDLAYSDLQPSGYAGYVVECLEAAAWCCLNSETLEEALVRAVNLAGEADTIAAVAGGAAGARWSLKSIPDRWLGKLHERGRIEQVASALVERRRKAYAYAAAPTVSGLDFNWCMPGVYAGRNPLTAADVEELKDLGVSRYLDLRQSHEYAAPRVGMEAIEALGQLGIERMHLPVEDAGHMPVQAVRDAAAYLRAALAQPGTTVYVSCRAGWERTAAVLIAYDCRTRTVDYDTSLDELRAGCPNFNPLPNQKRAIQEFLREAEKEDPGATARPCSEPASQDRPGAIDAAKEHHHIQHDVRKQSTRRNSEKVRKMSSGLSNKLAGQIGEHLVCAELGRRGYIATPFSGNVPTFDVVAADADRKTVAIQVKATRFDNWPSDARQWMHLKMDGNTQVYGGDKDLPDTDLIYVCVVIASADDPHVRDRFFILTKGELQKACSASYKEWMDKRTTPWERPRNPESYDCRYYIAAIAQYENKWETITQQLKPAEQAE